ncbi:MAG: hypothetical protein KF744_00620 [Taibaiella sp.]|nr:hypothetical protein [Taibaiella sp.]
MRLILTNYIASLKEDKELDSLIQDILREFDAEIIFEPQRGRQYGVDIYAVGVDPDDGVRKVLLITVKQGNLDRKNWQGSEQSLYASLGEIVTVFVRNNILPEHRDLPIGIIVAHNGRNEPNIQQNFVAFAEQNSQYNFSIWHLERLVNLVEEKLVSEYVFSDNARKMLRKVLINLYNPDYDLVDFCALLDEILLPFSGVTSKKNNLKLVRKANLVTAIALAYCEEENDLRLAVKASEVSFLRLWDVYTRNASLFDEGYAAELAENLRLRQKYLDKYVNKISAVCQVKDGFCKNCNDPIAYSLLTYEHAGFLATAGLEALQLAEMVSDELFARYMCDKAQEYANLLVEMFNNNHILYSPRFDSCSIEINLVFILLFKLDRKQSICDMLVEYNNQIANAKLLANVFPNFYNNIDEVYEQEFDHAKRQSASLQSSLLLINLIEWTLVLDDQELYDAFVRLKQKVFPEVDLILWFPNAKTEELVFKANATSSTGYSLSNINPDENYADFKQLTIEEYLHNRVEVDYFANKQGMWAANLVASRLYRTYVFPHYWRQFIE